MDIVFSANNRQEVKVLPVVSPDSVEISIPQDNMDFDTINGKIKLIGQMGLTTVRINSFFPTKRYSWMRHGASADGWSYVKFFDTWRKAKVPIRFVMTTDEGATRLNIACVVNDFSYSVDQAGDIQYSLDIEEYKFV